MRRNRNPWYSRQQIFDVLRLLGGDAPVQAKRAADRCLNRQRRQGRVQRVKVGDAQSSEVFFRLRGSKS
jgi:hypothetical protein